MLANRPLGANKNSIVTTLSLYKNAIVIFYGLFVIVRPPGISYNKIYRVTARNYGKITCAEWAGYFVKRTVQKHIKFYGG